MTGNEVLLQHDAPTAVVHNVGVMLQKMST